MALTGDYEVRAAKSYKTIEGKELLAAVRRALAEIDVEFSKHRNQDSAERGREIARISNDLEVAADRYDLFGEKDRRRKR